MCNKDFTDGPNYEPGRCQQLVYLLKLLTLSVKYAQTRKGMRGPHKAEALRATAPGLKIPREEEESWC